MFVQSQKGMEKSFPSRRSIPNDTPSYLDCPFCCVQKNHTRKLENSTLIHFISFHHRLPGISVAIW